MYESHAWLMTHIDSLGNSERGERVTERKREKGITVG